VAEEAHRAGMRRLFWGEHRRAIKGLTGKLPDFGKMKLQYLLLGRSKELQEDLLTLIVDRALYGPPTERVPRNLKEYEAVVAVALTRLNEVAETVGELVAKILEEHLKLALLMEVRGKGVAEVDVHDQLVFLLPKHFLVRTEYAWLEQFRGTWRGCGCGWRNCGVAGGSWRSVMRRGSRRCGRGGISILR